MKKATFEKQFRGYGFNTKIENKNEQHTDELNQMIVTRISGPGIKFIDSFLNLTKKYTLFKKMSRTGIHFMCYNSYELCFNFVE
jgi:hypothetical protein